MTMSLDDFYTSLAALDLKWHIDAHDAIRCAAGDCPIVALYNQTHFTYSLDNEGWDKAARELGLDEGDSVNIIESADYTYEDDDTRTALLKSCGLAL